MMSNASDYYPPLVVGVIGDRRDEVFNNAEVHKAVEDVLSWLHEGKAREGGPAEMAKGLGMKKTAVLLLSSLASKADIWTTQKALGMGMKVRCPLAFEEGLRELDASQRQKLLEGSENVFVVEMAEDVALTQDELKAQRVNDLLDDKKSLRRYRAAGEYISTQADILIAICDQIQRDDDPEKSKETGPGLDDPSVCLGVVRSRLQGLEPGLLPAGTSLSWADNGPVIRIYSRGAKSETDLETKDPNIKEPDAGAIEFWHPSDVRKNEELEAAWNKRTEREMESLHEYVQCFERLNTHLAEKKPDEDAGRKAFRPAKAYRPTTELENWFPCVREEWAYQMVKPPRNKEAAPLLLNETMKRIAVTRRMVGDVNYDRTKRVDQVIFRLLLLSFGIVLAIQANEAWNPKNEWEVMLPICALALFLWGAVWRHRRNKKAQIFNLQNDTRAIAEGLRVQFFWMAAGLSFPVAGHYLQRCRGEVSWIRGVISNLSFPLESCRRAFERLMPEEKHRQLQMVVDSWVAEQEAYFAKAAHTQSRRKTRREFLGNMFLIAGGVMFMANAVQKTCFEPHAGGPMHELMLKQGWAPLTLLLVVMGALWLGRQFLTIFATKEHEEARHNGGQKTGGTDCGEGWWERDYKLRQCHGGWFYLPAGLLLGWAALCGMHQFPEELNWESAGSVVKNVLFAFGGLFHATNVFRFATENCRRYAATHDLFRAAHLRLDDLLKQHGEAVKEVLQPEQQRLERAIQDYLKVLGEEALHENSAWLEMRRDRPVEPLTPGT